MDKFTVWSRSFDWRKFSDIFIFLYLVKRCKLFDSVACALDRVADHPELRPEPHGQEPGGQAGDLVVAEDEAFGGRGQERLDVRINVSYFVS